MSLINFKDALAIKIPLCYLVHIFSISKICVGVIPQEVCQNYCFVHHFSHSYFSIIHQVT